MGLIIPIFSYFWATFIPIFLFSEYHLSLDTLRFTPQDGGRLGVTSNAQLARSQLPLTRQELSPQLQPDLHREQHQTQQQRQQEQSSPESREFSPGEEEEEESIAEEPVQQIDQVRPSPPPENLRNNLSEILHVDSIAFLSVRQQRTFHNDRFNVTGRVYFVGVDHRPKVQDRYPAFMQVMRDLENTMLQQIQPDDYVQLIFKSDDLNNDFVLPIVRMDMFDARVAGEQFAAILTSNTKVDVGRGDFRIAVYHTRVPGGGARAREWGKILDKWFKSKKSIIRVSSHFNPHCLAVALKVGVLVAENKHKNYLETRSKRNIFRVLNDAKKIREDCGLPTDGELKVSHIKKLIEHVDFCEHPVTVFSRKNDFSVIYHANDLAPGRPIYLVHENGHFDALTSVPALVGKSRGFFCHKCQRYDLRKRHKCEAKSCVMCKGFCGSDQLSADSTSVKCTDCGRLFFNRRCYDSHKNPYMAATNDKPTCDTI